MELIKEIKSRRDVGEHLRKWGLFLCPYCLQEVERDLSSGKKYKSCGCSHNQLVKENHAHLKGEQHPLFGKIAWNRGISPTEETKQKMIEKAIGRKHTEETKQKISATEKYKVVTDETKKKQSEAQKGSKGANWQGGKSFEIYPPEFNKELKQQILERDNYTCQCPNCEHKTNKVYIHHIDYNKKNNNPENLITLCNSCHSKTNGKNNRLFWIDFYQTIMRVKCNSVLL